MAIFPSHNLISEDILKNTFKPFWNKSKKSEGASFDIHNNESINICIINSQFLASTSKAQKN